MGLPIRLAYLSLFIAVWVTAYSVAPHLGVCAPIYLDFDPAKYLPVVTWFVWPYVSFGAMPVVVFATRMDKDELRAATACFIGIVLVSVTVYILFPTAIVKPTIESNWHFAGSLLHVVHKTDTNMNCFPSLHVSISMFCSFLLSRLRPGGRRWWWGWGIAIVLSTLFTGQHYFVDVAGGLLVAWLAARAFKRYS